MSGYWRSGQISHRHISGWGWYCSVSTAQLRRDCIYRLRPTAPIQRSRRRPDIYLSSCEVFSCDPASFCATALDGSYNREVLRVSQPEPTNCLSICIVRLAMKAICRSLLILLLPCNVLHLLRAQPTAVPAWAYPGSATHVQV